MCYKFTNIFRFKNSIFAVFDYVWFLGVYLHLWTYVVLTATTRNGERPKITADDVILV